MSGRGKSKGQHAFPGDFIALGSKAGSSKATTPTAPAHAAPVLHKNVKVKTMKGVGGSGERLQAGPGQWEVVAMDYVDLNDLVPQVDDARLEGDHERIEGLLCGAVKALRSSRAKPDAVAWLSLLSLAKSQPKLFSGSELVKEALCSLLKRDVRESFKSKGNCLVSVMAANVLYAAFQDLSPWPESFLRVYVEDAMGERLWVDQQECKLFADNILTAFNTVLPPSMSREGEVGLACPSPPTGGSSSGSRTPTRPDDEVQIIELPINREVVEVDSGVVQRYGARLVEGHWRMEERVELVVVEIVRDQLTRRQQGQGTENITRNFIRFLTYACGSGEVRQVASSRLEMWMMNPKISRSAQELLCGVTLNCVTHTAMDVEVMVLLTKLRLKSKPNINLFLSCIKDLCTAHPSNLATLLKHTIFNELSNARNTNNMAMLGVMFQAAPEKAAGALASVFLELLMQKDCYLRALRILLREIVRCLRHDINLVVFCEFLMTERLREEFDFFREFEFKERMFSSLVDLVTLSIFLGISPTVREGLNIVTRGERKDVSQYKKYLLSVSEITRVAVRWLHESVLKQYKPDPATYTSCLYKALFMARSHEDYYQLDGWPLEADRGLYFKLTSEVPVQQEAILRIFLIGLSKSHPVIGQDCLTIAETLMKRAAGLHGLASKDFPVLYSDKAKDFRECVWNLTAYTFPESISLPPDYQPPSMAITASYWKAWQMLLIMTAYNPEEFGAYGWENYPTLRAMMEMCITSQFVFPPPTVAASPEKLEEVRATETQVCQLEKQQILEFESQLAAASSKQLITEQSSLLLATITSMDPHGPLRRPPQAVLEQLKQMNAHYKLGHLLCRSRQPDFLLDILQRQGTNQAMPWLADLVESSEGSFSVLPVQCLCEFLLNDAFSQQAEDDPKGGKKRKAGELLVHLQTLLQHPASDAATCLETLDYFLARLSSVQSSARQQALSGLRLLLTPVSQDEAMDTEDSSSSDWLLRHLPALPCFPMLHRSLAASLRQACQVECHPPTVSLYVRFLSQTQKLELEEMGDLALDMATVIVERSSLLPALLPGTSHPAATGAQVQAATYSALLAVFYNYMQLVRQQDAGVAWSESQDLINVVWGSGECATLHILVVHAQIILLTYGGAARDGGDTELFAKLLLMWFPPGQELPRAYLVDTSEEALLIPDWLKLKMIRSSVQVLVDSALKDLDPQQLVLFIQSFGIPVESMSKLLQTLDQEVVEDLEAVASSVLDKVYMGQLVGVQHNRGAQGGLVFAKRLGLSLEVGGGGGAPRDTVASLPALVIPPRSTAMIPPSQIRATLLHLYDCGSPSRMTLKEKQDTFRTLQKSLTAEICGVLSVRPMLDSTVSAIQAILQSDLGQGFITALAQKTAFSTGLFRLISVALAKPNLRTSPTAKTLLAVSKKLLQQFTASTISTPLTALLRTFIESLDPGARETVKESGEGAKTEEEIRSLAESALRREDTAPLVARLSSLLLRDRGEGGTPPGGLYMAQAGLLVDWLELLDPTVISSCPELQQQLVFGRAGPRVGEGGASHSSRPYLLSLLTHQASWPVLRSTVASLLRPGTSDTLDPAAVLDFLSACIHIPRLWQGRDQRPPVHDQPPDVLALEVSGLGGLVDLVLAEAREAGEEGRQVVMARMALVLRCLPTRDKLAAVVQHLTEDSSSLARDLLAELYMRIPAALATTSSGALPSPCPLAGESVVDSVSHTLLSSLSSVQPGKQWTVRMAEQEVAARKLLSSHPGLFLRNLPLLASSLQGRTHLEFPVFRSRNHLTLFTIHLGLLELARPQVFHPSCLPALESALGCFMDMLEAYFQRRDSFYYTIDRLVQFLSSWQAAGGAAALRAAAFLRRHARGLLAYHSAPGTAKMDSLRNLVAGLAPALHAQPGEAALEESSPPSQPEPCSSLEPELGRLLAELQGAEQERVLPLLQELQSAANPRPGVLRHFQEELTYHIASPVPQVRNVAYTLVLKHLKQRPDCWAALLPAYLAALQCGQEDKVESALHHLPEFAVLAQQKGGELLAAVFRLGVYSNISTTQHINAAIARLNMQGGT